MTDMTKDDFELVSQIANRALKMYKQFPDIRDDKIDVMLDVEKTHDQIPLDFEKFLRFDDSNFAHDMFGIRQYMDRATATLGGCFLPRCSLPSS